MKTVTMTVNGEEIKVEGPETALSEDVIGKIADAVGAESVDESSAGDGGQDDGSMDGMDQGDGMGGDMGPGDGSPDNAGEMTKKPKMGLIIGIAAKAKKPNPGGGY
jgi:hypothetical protein